MLTARPAQPTDLDRLADLWERGWHDGHDGHVPDAFQAARTTASFRERMAQRIPTTTVVEVPEGSGTVGTTGIACFVTVVDDELEQVYVDADHRGTDVAPRLMAEGLRVVAAAGHPRAFLAVVVGNARARRFYEREGWVDHGRLDYLAEGPDGPIVSPCRRYERDT